VPHWADTSLFARFVEGTPDVHPSTTPIIRPSESHVAMRETDRKLKCSAKVARFRLTTFGISRARLDFLNSNWWMARADGFGTLLTSRVLHAVPPSDDNKSGASAHPLEVAGLALLGSRALKAVRGTPSTTLDTPDEDHAGSQRSQGRILQPGPRLTFVRRAHPAAHRVTPLPPASR